MSSVSPPADRLQDLVRGLSEIFPVVDDPSYKSLINFKQNRTLPVHSWFDYKQGYSPELIQKLVNDLDIPRDGKILDPFNGVGTTLLAADSLGMSSVGLDVNPVAVLASKVKNRAYSREELHFLELVLDRFGKKKPEPFARPNYKSLPRIFSEKQLDELLVIRSFVEQQEQHWARSFLLLAFVSVVEPVSNRIKDGNGIKISKSKIPVEDVFGLFSQKVREMLNDLKLAPPRGLGQTVFGSILDDKIREQIGHENFDAVIYSPPYANCFDYMEVYKMELWMGGFVQDYSDFAQFRNASVRSHVNSTFSKTLNHDDDQVAVVSAALAGVKLWNRNIPAMVAGYFDDMTGVLERAYDSLKHGGSSAIVVANSSYQGLIVPTDLLLAKIAQGLGFKVERLLKARDIRGSSQHMARTTAFDGLMRETVIMLRKI